MQLFCKVPENILQLQSWGLKRRKNGLWWLVGPSPNYVPDQITVQNKLIQIWILFASLTRKYWRHLQNGWKIKFPPLQAIVWMVEFRKVFKVFENLYLVLCLDPFVSYMFCYLNFIIWKHEIIFLPMIACGDTLETFLVERSPVLLLSKYFISPRLGSSWND